LNSTDFGQKALRLSIVSVGSAGRQLACLRSSTGRSRRCYKTETVKEEGTVGVWPPGLRSGASFRRSPKPAIHGWFDEFLPGGGNVALPHRAAPDSEVN